MTTLSLVGMVFSVLWVVFLATVALAGFPWASVILWIAGALIQYAVRKGMETV